MIVWLNGTHGVLVESYWDEIRAGPAGHGIPVHHFVLHADQATLRDRIENDPVLGPSMFRYAHLAPYEEAARTWLHDDAHVVDTSKCTPQEAAAAILGALPTDM